MAQATVPVPVEDRTRNDRTKRAATILAWAGIVVLAVGFVIKYVLFYYRHYDAASWESYWPRRGWLLLHTSGGTVALLTGPWQFWTGLRQRSFEIHRRTPFVRIGSCHGCDRVNWPGGHGRGSLGF